ncbi:MAG: V-type ATPase subunit [Anaerococcus sp.]|nr:V-type ATPase subunit [Anaerococcus sp.]MDY2918083.1 V-type ATPase subunit [Anaerococcus sp.]
MKDVSVKAKAKMGKLPTRDLYDKLISDTSLENKKELLNHKYPFLKNVNTKKEMEAGFFNNFYTELRSIDFFLGGIESQFFKNYFSIYEIYLIQKVIQSIVHHRLEKNILNLLHDPFSKNLHIKIGMDLKDFIEGLRTSRYYRTLLPFVNENMDEDALIFLSSNALMKFYYRDLLKLSKEFKGKEKSWIKELLGEQINLANFEMVFRLKKFFKLNNNEIFNYLIEGGRGYNAERLKQLANMPLDDFLDRLNQSKYKGIFDRAEFSHIKIKERMAKLYMSEIRKQRSDILYVISVMSLIRIHYESLVGILEIDETLAMSDRYDLVIGR